MKNTDLEVLKIFRKRIRYSKGFEPINRKNDPRMFEVIIPGGTEDFKKVKEWLKK